MHTVSYYGKNGRKTYHCNSLASAWRCLRKLWAGDDRESGRIYFPGGGTIDVHEGTQIAAAIDCLDANPAATSADCDAEYHRVLEKCRDAQRHALSH